MRNCFGFLLVFDLSNPKQTLEELVEFVEQINRIKESETYQKYVDTSKMNSFPCVIVGNKNDLPHEQTEKEIKKYMQNELNLNKSTPLLFCSAKKGENVDEAFFELIREMRKFEKNVNEKANSNTQNGKSGNSDSSSNPIKNIFSSGSSKQQKEAEEYDGPSLIIAYSPCIAHGLKEGMGCSVDQEGKAVESGYWHLYRYNPELKGEKNPFSLDSKEPTGSFRDFLLSEVRFSSLKKTFPEVADDLFARSEEDANERYESYKRLEASFEPDEE
jgi:pyruvate/2-oxoacid:ferredoxin oxidoreductase beta subunit